MIHLKRVYDKKEENEFWVLVDRLWPRGIKKEKIDLWLKDLAPSDNLREEYHHTKDFESFKKKYIKELETKDVKPLLDIAKIKDITLVYASKDPQNNASILKEYLN